MSEDFYEPEPWEENSGRQARVLPTGDDGFQPTTRHKSINPDDWAALGFIVEERGLLDN